MLSKKNFVLIKKINLSKSNKQKIYKVYKSDISNMNKLSLALSESKLVLYKAGILEVQTA